MIQLSRPLPLERPLKPAPYRVNKSKLNTTTSEDLEKNLFTPTKAYNPSAYSHTPHHSQPETSLNANDTTDQPRLVEVPKLYESNVNKYYGSSCTSFHFPKLVTFTLILLL
jgi:hypothetical protein